MPAPSRWRSIAIVALVLLVGSIGANLVLFRVGQTYYAHEQDVRLDPSGLLVHEAERKAAGTHTKPVVALFGDSRIAMWPTPSIDGYDVVNLGIGNQTTEQTLLRFDEDVAPLRPQVIVLQVGVNDLKTLPLFPARRDAIVGECKANLARIVHKSAAVGAKVLVTTIFSLGDVPIYRRAVWSPEPTKAAIEEVNAYARTLAGGNVTIVEADPIFDDSPGKVKPPFQFDYLHENPAAYAALDERIVSIVRGLGPLSR